MARNLTKAEAFLRTGSSGGDVAASRNLGLLLLELGRPEEAAAALRLAADGGDGLAMERLRELGEEADGQHAKARAQLQRMADAGDARAAAMLAELGLS